MINIKNLLWIGLALIFSAYYVSAEIVIDDPIFIDQPEEIEEPIIVVPAPVNEGSKPQSAKSFQDQEAPATPFESHINFLNGDKIHGRLLNANGDDGTIEWQHETVVDPINFSVKGISDIKLMTVMNKDTRNHSANIILSNDDIIRGDLLSVNNSKVTVDTWYAGKVALNRVMVKSILPNAQLTSAIYSGPNDIANWTISNNNQPSWKFQKGAFTAIQSYPIARNIDNMPDMANIEFSAAWRAYPQFYFAFYTDNLKQYYGNCYMMQISTSSIYLNSYTRNGNQRSLGNINYPNFGNGQSTGAKFNILVNKKEKTFALLINDAMVNQWQDNNNFAGLGNGILFQPQSRANLKIFDINISEWDGRLPQKETDEDRDEDLIKFINSDKVSGELESIANGKVKFKTSYATLDIPIDRVVKIDMSSKELERARRNAHDIKAFLKGGGAVTMNFKTIANNTITGESENFGEISSPVNAFRQLNFNIYEERKDEDEDEFSF